MLEDNSKRRSQIDPNFWWSKRDEHNNNLLKNLTNLQNKIGFFFLTLFVPTFQNFNLNQEIFNEIEKIFLEIQSKISSKFSQFQQEFQKFFEDSFLEEDKKNFQQLLISIFLALQQNFISQKQQSTLIEDLFKFYKPQNTYLQYISVQNQENELLNLLNTLKEQCQNISESKEISPISILLSENLQFLPFESLPIFDIFNVSIYRLPSIDFYIENIERERTKNINLTFYLLNPKQDLVNSQKMLQPEFEKWQNWTGCSGKECESKKMVQQVLQKDFYLYAGHGGGETELRISDLKQINNINSTNLLMGCSSAKLISGFSNTLFQNIDQYGYTLEFAISGALLSIGGLSDVTDKDADKLILEILKVLKKQSPQNEIQIASLFRKSKSVCRLQNMNGSIFVMYGLPISVVNR